MQKRTLEELLNVMTMLRDPEHGCPWDKKQTFSSIVPHTIEEAYEVADAIEQNDFNELKNELGDLLFQVVFYAQLAKEQDYFEFDDILTALTDKLKRRHPHVFSDAKFKDDEAITQNWEAEKEKERSAKAKLNGLSKSILDNIPRTLPAMSRAYKIQKRCARVGFDWETVPPVIDKINEELDEVLFELQRDDLTEDAKQARIEDELGDLLFANINLIRHLGAEPENVLRQANHKFEMRFKKIEEHLAKSGNTVEECELDTLDALWNKVKEQSSF